MQYDADICWVSAQIKLAKKPEQQQQRMYVDHRGEVFQWSVKCKDIGKMVWVWRSVNLGWGPRDEPGKN